MTLLDRAFRQLAVWRGFTSRMVETDPGPVHVLDRAGVGTGPPLVLVHGFGASALNFGALLTVFHHACRHVYTLDLPAHGLTPAPADGLSQEAVLTALSQSLAAVGAQRATYLGYSFGGAVSVRFANRHPERVAGLMLVSPAGAPVDAADLQRIREVFDVNTHAQGVAFMDRLRARPHWSSHLLSPDVRTRLREPALREWIRRIDPSVMLGPDEVRALPCPARVLWGSEERVLPAHGVDFWREHLGPDRVEVCDGWGHSAMLDDAAGLATRTLAFLEQLDEP